MRTVECWGDHCEWAGLIALYIHLYFVSEKDKAQICPDGETAKPGEKVLRYSRR